MLLIWGSRQYGKVDEVPGLFHVATRFFHIWFIPLIPLQSYIVLQRTGNSFHGMATSMSGKSVLAGYARIWPFFVSAACMLFALPMFALAKTGSIVAGVVAVLIAAGCMVGGILSYTHASMQRATYERAVELAEKLKLPEEGLVMIELAYGRVTEEDAKATLEALRADAQEMERIKQERAGEIAARTLEMQR